MVVIGPPSSMPAIPWFSVSVTFLLIIPFLSWDSPQFSLFPFLVHQLRSPYFSFYSYLSKISCVSKKKYLIIENIKMQLQNGKRFLPSTYSVEA